MTDVIKHYDNLIDEDNDSFRDPEPLKDYMNKWDGQKFVDSMHFKDKQGFISKIATLLNGNGRFVLSIDKNQSDYIDVGTYKLKIYPDTPENIINCINATDLHIEKQFETEFAHVFVCTKIYEHHNHHKK